MAAMRHLYLPFVSIVTSELEILQLKSWTVFDHKLTNPAWNIHNH
jgi:hypothetical protein